MTEVETEAEQHVRVFELGEVRPLQQTLVDVDRAANLTLLAKQVADDHLDFERVGTAAGGLGELIDRLIQLVLGEKVQPEHVMRRLAEPPAIDPAAVTQ